MQRLVTFQWSTPPPTSVDEQVAVYDDASAWLVVRRPRELSAVVGTFRSDLDSETMKALTAYAPGPVAFDLRSTPQDPEAMALADRLAAEARTTPYAAAEFFSAPIGGIRDGKLSASLLVVGRGTHPTEFELDPASSAIHFLQDGQPVNWQEFPDLPMGFMTPDAEGLGGVRGPAHIEPGTFGAIAIEASAPTGATALSIQVAGWLRGALPDEPTPERFEVRTAESPIAG